MARRHLHQVTHSYQVTAAGEHTMHHAHGLRICFNKAHKAKSNYYHILTSQLEAKILSMQLQLAWERYLCHNLEIYHTMKQTLSLLYFTGQSW